MEHFIVTRADNSTYQLPGNNPRSKIISAEQKRVLMGEDVVTMEVESVGYINFQIGDWIEVFGEKYTLNTLGEPERIGDNLFRYTLTWEGIKYELTKVIYRSADWTGFNPSSEFSLTGTAEDFLTVMQYNLKRAFGEGVWTIGSVPETEAKTLSFNSENCLAVLNTLCQEFGTEYVITKSGNIFVINLQKAGSVLSIQLEYGRGKGLYSLSRKNVDSKNIITRLYTEGSDKNIKVGYRDNATRLQLPDKAYIDSDNISKYGIIEGSKIFDDIYPHRTGVVSALGPDELTFVDEEMFDLNEKDADGNTKWLIPGQTAKIHFNSGNLAGYEFEIASYNHATHTFKIKPFEDERGLVFPNPDSPAFQIQPGDKYVILDIIMPDSYVTEAENELLSKAQEYLAQNEQPRVEYSLKLDRFYLKDTFAVDGTLPNIFQPGDYIHVVDTKIGVDKNVRVKEFVRNIIDPYEYDVTLSDVIEPTRIERLISDTIESKKALQKSKLFNPARTRRNWRDIEEVTNMIDTLRAEVALIGTEEGQFQLDCFFEINKNGDANRFGATGGVLIHDSYTEIGTWNMSAFDVTLTENSAYYLYAKCSRNSDAGMFLLSLTKIGVEDDPDWYHFPIGVLSSVNNDARTLTTTYGYTLISGNNISTGIIKNDASGIMINLETGEIRGAFTFSNGQLIEDAVNEKSSQHFGGTDPSVGWTTIEEKRKHVNDTWIKLTDESTEEYIWLETGTDTFEWVLNETSIDAGRIKTGTIDADRIDLNGLFAKEIYATNFTLGKGKIGDFEVSSILYNRNDNGQEIYIDPTNRMIAIDDKAEGSGISSVKIRGGSLTPQAEIDGQSASTFETSVESDRFEFAYNSNELRAGKDITVYFGKYDETKGIVSSAVPETQYQYNLETGKNYSADFRFLFSIIHSKETRLDKLDKLHGNLTLQIRTKLIGIDGTGLNKVLVDEAINTVYIERNDQELLTTHPTTRKSNFYNKDCVSCYWEVKVHLEGDLTYQERYKDWPFGEYWSTNKGLDIDFGIQVGQFHNFYPSLGVTELTTSGFQSIWAANRFFRINGESGPDDIFIESAGKWVHNGPFYLNGAEIVTLDNVSSAIASDLSAYATKQYVQEGFVLKSEAENFAKLNSDNVFQGNVTIQGNLIQEGSTYETHAEQVYTANDFIIMRDGAMSGLGSNLSGFKILKADGYNNLILAAGSDAIGRIGWEDDVLQAIATREDDPVDNGIAYWDAANSMFKTDSVFIKDGKLGIGTTPDEKLHIEEGKIRVIKTSVGSGITPLIILGVNSTTNGDGAAIDFITSSDGVSVGAQIAGLRTGGGALGSLVFRTRDTSYTLKERMRINQNGNVGINKPDPEERLHIDGNVVVQNYSNPNAFIRLRNSYHGLDLFLQNYYTGQSAVSQFSSYISRSIYIDENGNWKRKSKWSSGSTIRFGESANHVPFISFLIDTDNTTATDTVNLEEAVRITDSLDVKFSSDLQNNGTFISGFAGSGWKLDGSESHLTVDKLTVRKTFDVYELNMQRILGSNGSIAVSNSVKIESVTDNGDGTYVCYIDTDSEEKLYVNFRKDDIIKIQNFNGKNVKYFVGKILSVTTTSFTVQGLDDTEAYLFAQNFSTAVPTSTNFDGGIIIDVSGISGKQLLVIRGKDFEGGVTAAVRNKDTGEIHFSQSLSGGDNEEKYYYLYPTFTGNDEISIYSTNTDYGVLYYVSVRAKQIYNKPEKGDVAVQWGNFTDTNRQGLIYLTNSDNGAPYIDVLDGLSDARKTNQKPRLRIGKLSGISGQSGYGIWASQNGTDTDFVISSDGYAKIAGWDFDNVSLTKTINDNKLHIGRLPNVNQYGFSAGDGTDANIVKIWSANYKDGGYIEGRKDGKSIFILSTNDTSKIAGITFDDEKLYTSKWTLNKDGSFSFGGGKITGDASGNVEIDGDLIANSINTDLLIAKNLKTNDTTGRRIEILGDQNSFIMYNEYNRPKTQLLPYDVMPLSQIGESGVITTTWTSDESFSFGRGGSSGYDSDTREYDSTKTITISDERTYSITTPEVEYSLSATNGASVNVSVFLKKSDGSIIFIGSKNTYNNTTGGVISSKTINGLTAGTYRIHIKIGWSGGQGSYGVGTATIKSGSVLKAEAAVEFNQIGLDGFNFVSSASKYVHNSENVFQVMKGNYGIRVTTSGIQKTTNGGSSWSTIT